MDLLQRILQKWSAWLLPRPRLILGIAFVTAIASVIFTAMKLDMLTDQLKLISTRHPLVALSDKLDRFNSDGKRRFTLVTQASEPEKAASFVQDLASKIMQDPAHFQGIIYRLDPDAFKPWLLLYLDDKDLSDIRSKLSENSTLIKGLAEDPELLTFLKLVNQEMASRMVGELFTGFLDEEKSGKELEGKKDDHFDLGFLIATLEGISDYLRGSFNYKSPWTSLFAGTSWNPDLEGYFWEGGKRYLIAFVIPKKNPADGFTKTQESLEHLRSIIKELELSHPGIQAGVTGQEALNNDELTTVLGDMAKATWLSLVGVLLLMIIFMQGLRHPLVEMICLTVGLCWTFGWTTLFIGHLNILSVVFAPLLCGLGVDYGIHWFARYEEESYGEHDPRRLVSKVNDRSGPAIFLAGLSAALSFLPLVLTGFRGLVELGLITGVGILFILLSTLSVLPALTIFLGGRKRRYYAAVVRRERTLFRFNQKSAGFVLAGTAVTCVLCLWSANRVYFDLNPLRLQTANAESVVWEKTLIENSRRSAIFASAFANSPEELMAKAKKMESLPSVSEVESVYSLLPENQHEKIPIVHSMRNLIPEIRPTVIENRPSETRAFIDILQRIRFKMQDDQADRWGANRPLVDQMREVRNLTQDISSRLEASSEAPELLFEYRKQFRNDLLKKWDTLRKATKAVPMTVDDLPEVVRNWFYQDGTFLLRIFPKESIWEQNALTRFVRELQAVDPQVIGDPVSLFVFADAFKKACVNASVYAVIAILALLLFTFRKISLTLLAFTPVVIGTIITLGIMGIAGIQFNLANSMFMPLVVGAGVEYSVVILQRWREGKTKPGHLPLSTGKGVILAALTTTLGFGSLMISQHRGIFSLGFIAWSGSLCVLASAIIVLPALLAGMDQPEVR